MDGAPLPGLEDIAPGDLSFVVAFLRENGFSTAEASLMGELEARIIASATGEPPDGGGSAWSEDDGGSSVGAGQGEERLLDSSSGAAAAAAAAAALPRIASLAEGFTVDVAAAAAAPAPPASPAAPAAPLPPPRVAAATHASPAPSSTSSPPAPRPSPPASPAPGSPLERDEYADEEDPGYVRFEVGNVALFLAREVDDGSGTPPQPLTVHAPAVPSSPSPPPPGSPRLSGGSAAAASPAGGSPRASPAASASASERGSGGSPAQLSPRAAELAAAHAAEERAAAAALLAACSAASAGRSDHHTPLGADPATAALLAARRRAVDWEHAIADGDADGDAAADAGTDAEATPQAPRRRGGAAGDGDAAAAEAEGDDTPELVRHYYEAREVFEFVDEEALHSHAAGAGEPSPAASRASGDGGGGGGARESFTLASPAAAAAPLAVGGGAGFGGFGGGFTFSPVSAPSPPMSLTAFSWRSATDDDDEAEEPGDEEAESSGGAGSGAAAAAARARPGSRRTSAGAAAASPAAPALTVEGIAFGPPGGGAAESAPPAPGTPRSEQSASDTAAEQDARHKHGQAPAAADEAHAAPAEPVEAPAEPAAADAPADAPAAVDADTQRAAAAAATAASAAAAAAAALLAAASAAAATPSPSPPATPEPHGSASPAASVHAASPPPGGATEDESPYETLELRVIHRRNRTGFEEAKDFPIVMGSVVAGRYQITEYLGSAAFSKAVQAHDLQTGMLVCMKIIKNSKDFFDQSLDEIKLLKLLNRADPGDDHNLLRLYDYFYHKEHLFIVTELLRANLYEFQKYNRESGEAPYFTCSRLQRIASQVLHALAFMHSLKILHCDLKPENILIRSYSRCLVKVIDVGSSCFSTDHLSSYVQSRSYRAPEVILGLPYDGRIDVWSLGCILAELYSGYVLFQNDSLATLLARCVGILGPVPPRLLQGRHAHKYFTRAGELYERDDEAGRAFLLRPKRGGLRHRLRGADEGFVAFVHSLLAMDADARPTAAQALRHPWFAQQYPPDEEPA